MAIFFLAKRSKIRTLDVELGLDDHDVRTSSAAPDDNFNGMGLWLGQYPALQYFFLRMASSNFPDAIIDKIVSAHLWLYCEDKGGGPPIRVTGHVISVSEDPFDEATLTWNTMPNRDIRGWTMDVNNLGWNNVKIGTLGSQIKSDLVNGYRVDRYDGWSKHSDKEGSYPPFVRFTYVG